MGQQTGWQDYGQYTYWDRIKEIIARAYNMVLDLGSGLFQRKEVTATQQSALVERWQQEGSDRISTANFLTENTGNQLIRNVTSGKVFYIKSMQVSIQTIYNNAFYLSSPAAINPIWDSYPLAAGLYSVVFDPPLAATTAVYVSQTAGGAGVATINLQGWEEDA